MTTDIIKAYCGKGSQSLCGNYFPAKFYENKVEGCPKCTSQIEASASPPQGIPRAFDALSWPVGGGGAFYRHS